MLRAPSSELRASMKRHIHFIGIGGIGVSGIAQLASQRGEKVSGSDIKASVLIQKLVSLGIPVVIGHKAENIQGADLVVYSSAIRPENPELAAARAQGIPVKRRAEFLSELMADKKVITVTGAHGKTTTSSLTAKLLISAGLNPTVAVGGILREDGDNVKLGQSDYFVAEADESDGTFLCYRPDYSIITNIDEEHLDYYKTYERLLSDFSKFVGQTKPQGCVFYCDEDRALRAIVQSSGVRACGFGFSSSSNIAADQICLGQGVLSFRCLKQGQVLGEFKLGLNGRHNVLNALSVVALGLELGIDLKKIQEALKGFKGVERRFQVKYEDKDIFIVDDYAHHPTEIRATIDAAKVCPRRRLVTVFQPHRYSRTQMLMDKFADSFSKSDYLVLTDIYAAGEDPIEGVDARHLLERIRRKSSFPMDYVKKDELIEYLKNIHQPDDCVLFLGAGDITKISDEFAKTFQK